MPLKQFMLTILLPPTDVEAQGQRLGSLSTPPCRRSGPCLRGPCVYAVRGVYVVLCGPRGLLGSLLFCVPVVLVVLVVQ